RDDVEQAPDAEAATARKQDHRDGDAGEAAMKRHAALPDREDGRRVLDVAGEVVEQDVAETSAQNDARGRPDEEIVDVDRADRAAARTPEAVIGDEAARIPPGEQDADNISQPVPVDRKRADLKQH